MESYCMEVVRTFMKGQVWALLLREDVSLLGPPSQALVVFGPCADKLRQPGSPYGRTPALLTHPRRKVQEVAVGTWPQGVSVEASVTAARQALGDAHRKPGAVLVS